VAALLSRPFDAGPFRSRLFHHLEEKSVSDEKSVRVFVFEEGGKRTTPPGKSVEEPT
jgi:hypothetical protein